MTDNPTDFTNIIFTSDSYNGLLQITGRIIQLLKLFSFSLMSLQITLLFITDNTTESAKIIFSFFDGALSKDLLLLLVEPT